MTREVATLRFKFKSLNLEIDKMSCKKDGLRQTKSRNSSSSDPYTTPLSPIQDVGTAQMSCVWLPLDFNPPGKLLIPFSGTVFPLLSYSDLGIRDEAAHSPPVPPQHSDICKTLSCQQQQFLLGISNPNKDPPDLAGQDPGQLNPQGYQVAIRQLFLIQFTLLQTLLAELLMAAA